METYELNWVGKQYAKSLCNTEPTTTLKEDVDWNNRAENKDSENLLIKGDNLEVLKNLKDSYGEKIKMIYIDPPYNTGKDFIYNDSRKLNIEEIQKTANVDESKAKQILKTLTKKGKSHSAWLTFMYPRLYIAKQLLKDDGVIFVSIDENEVAQLRILMDEIFGEDSYLKEIAWNSTKSVTNTAIISDNHSYIMIYAKNKEYYIKNRSEFRLPLDSKEQFSNPDNDPRGPWTADPFEVGGWRKNQQYKITNPNTGDIYTPNKGSSWKNDYKNFIKLLEDGRIVFGKKGESRHQRKRFLREAIDRGKVPKSVWIDESLWESDGTTTDGTRETKRLFDNKTVFKNPKPVKLLNRIVSLGSNKQDIVMDFFAGSATTGDAVMQLNAEDGGNRKYILVQLPEKIDPKVKDNEVAYAYVKNELKKEVPTIYDITKERLIRAAKKIQDEQQNTDSLDLGFKIYETTPNE